MGLFLPSTSGEMVSALGSMETAREEMREHKSDVVNSKHFANCYELQDNPFIFKDAPKGERKNIHLGSAFGE